MRVVIRIFAALSISTLLLFHAFLLSSAVTAQTSDSCEIRVALEDQAGNIIVDAEIRLLSTDGIAEKVRTNSDGVATFRGVSPAPYRIAISLAGFKPYDAAVGDLHAGETKRLVVSMRIADILSTVNVGENDEPSFDGTEITRQMKEEQIEHLPDDPEELLRVLRRLAGDAPTGEPLGITVNGIPGGPMPAKQDITLIRVNRNVFSAEFEGISGGGIEIFTASGIKKLSRSAAYSLSDSRWGAADPFIHEKVPYRIESFHGGIQGPFGPHASFSIGANWWPSRSSSVVNATVIGPSFLPTVISQSFSTPTSNMQLYLTVDANTKKKHQLQASYTYFSSGAKNVGVGGLTLVERGSKYDRAEHNFVFKDTYVASPDLVNTTRISARVSRAANKGSVASPSIDVEDAFFGGDSQIESTVKNDRFEFYNDTTKKVNRWNFGIGVMLRVLKVNDVSRSNFGGTYVFTGRVAPLLDSNNGPVRDNNGNLVTTQITSLESYRRTLLFRALGLSAARIRELGGGADQFSIAGGKPDIGVSQYEFGSYGQANYSLSQTIGLSFGIRYEYQSNVQDTLNIAPRAGVVWQPKSKEKQRPITTVPKVTVGMGLFLSRFPIANILNIMQANDPDRFYYFVRDPTILDLFPSVPNISELKQTQTPRSLRQLDPAFRPPRQALINVTITKEIGCGFSVTGSYTHAESLDKIVVRNINAPLAGTFPLAPLYPLGNDRSVQEYESHGHSRIDRFTVGINLPEWKIWNGTVYGSIDYRYQSDHGNDVAGSGSPSNAYDFSREWGPNTLDGQHVLSGLVDLPLPKRFSFFASWEVDSGSKFNIYTGRDTNGDGFYSERPAFARDGSKAGVVMTPYGLLDPNPTPDETLIPRNLGRGPIRREFDVGLSKSFELHRDRKNKNQPRQSLSFRVSVDNLFNFNNKAAPVGNMASPYFLQSIAGQTLGGGSGNSEQRKLTFRTSFKF